MSTNQSRAPGIKGKAGRGSAAPRALLYGLGRQQRSPPPGYGSAHFHNGPGRWALWSLSPVCRWGNRGAQRVFLAKAAQGRNVAGLGLKLESDITAHQGWIGGRQVRSHPRR